MRRHCENFRDFKIPLQDLFDGRVVLTGSLSKKRKASALFEEQPPRRSTGSANETTGRRAPSEPLRQSGTVFWEPQRFGTDPPQRSSINPSRQPGSETSQQSRSEPPKQSRSRAITTIRIGAVRPVVRAAIAISGTRAGKAKASQKITTRPSSRSLCSEYTEKNRMAPETNRTRTGYCRTVRTCHPGIYTSDTCWI